MGNFSLNEGQELAASKLSVFLKDYQAKVDNPKRFFTLTGDPGTGKTYMIKSILPKMRKPIVCATIAHAAKIVLQDAIGDKSIECVTIAKLLGLRPIIDDETGDISFREDSSAVPVITHAKTVILDEVSMIDDETAEMILDFTSTIGIDLICIGDKNQLTPVGQEEDSMFLKNPDAELTETMRFDEKIGSITKVYKQEIQKIHNDIRPDFRCLDNLTERKDWYDLEKDEGYKFLNNPETMLGEVIERIKANPNDMHDCRVLVYKNKTVQALNDYIRAKLYNDNRQFHYGELVICNGGFTAKDPKNGNLVPLMHNGEILRVDEAVEVEVEGIPCLSLSFIAKNTQGLLVPVVKNTHVARACYNAKLNELRENAKRDRRQWSKFYAFKDKFAVFDYGNVVNAHKAQGASINHVYVAEGEIMGIQKASLKNKYQALYVACSRARKSLTIYKR